VYATSLLASPSALAPEQRIRLRQVLIQQRFGTRDFTAAERLCRDALAEYPDHADFAWALIAALAEQGDMSRAAATRRQLNPALVSPAHVPLWLAVLTQRPVTDDDVREALTAAQLWPAAQAARQLLEGTAAAIAAQSPPGCALLLSPGISPGNLVLLMASLHRLVR
jgi:hypothetical protein